MENEGIYKKKCDFTVHPCNFKVEIKEVKPFNVCACKPILLDLKVINSCNVNSCIKIKSRPEHGKLFLLCSSILIYKSNRNFSGFDLFQVIVEDECGGMRTESILIHVI